MESGGERQKKTSENKSRSSRDCWDGKEAPAPKASKDLMSEGITSDSAAFSGTHCKSGKGDTKAAECTSGAEGDRGTSAARGGGGGGASAVALGHAQTSSVGAVSSRQPRLVNDCGVAVA